MKTFKELFFTLSITTVFSIASNHLAAQAQDASIKVFYEALSPFGQWMYDKNYGYVWTPSDKKLRPYYTNGTWVMTEHGSTWVSNYPWGWAPFHYGRWVYDSFYHWVWIPGTTWAPAWVVWRTSGEYVGWTPITPGTTISAAGGPSYYVPDDWWVFVPRKYFLNRDFQTHISPARNNPDLLKKISVNTTTRTASSYENSYFTGPQADQFARTGLNAPLYATKQMPKPGKSALSNNELSLYMPAVEKWEKGNEPKPAKFTNAAYPIGKISALGSSANASQPSSTAKKKPAAKSKLKTAAKKK
jgi:hypothetical protein